MERVYHGLKNRIMSADEVANMIREGMVLGCSGFTVVGDPKRVPEAIARKGMARELTLVTGASVSDKLDGVLTRAKLLARRYPYQSNASLRTDINSGVVLYSDLHLSHMPQWINCGGLKIDIALVECCAVTEQGIIPAASVGATDSLIRRADKVILEVNTALPETLYGVHDIYQVGKAPIPICTPNARIGTPYIPCPLEKICGIVLTHEREGNPTFREPDQAAQAIAEHIVQFLKREIQAGRQPRSLQPLQSGVGSVANAVLSCLAKGGFGQMRMYTEVLQDAALSMIRDGILQCASATALSLSREMEQELFEGLEWYKERIVLRPQEISNHPEVIRRLGLIAINTPIEADIYGNVNSTHVVGSNIMNGIGGSGDFARNAGLCIFATSSTAKGGRISTVVPMVSHVDHTEHDVMVFVTEQGLADLRWKAPRERARLIIENCAHPNYRPLLREYYRRAVAKGGHTPHDLSQALSWHIRLQEEGSMLTAYS